MKVIRIFKEECSDRNDITMFIKPKTLYKALLTDDIVEGFVRCKRNGVKVYLLFDKDDIDSPDKHALARFVVSYTKEGRPKLAEASITLLSPKHEKAKEYNMEAIKLALEALDRDIRWNRIWRSSSYENYRNL